MSNRKRELSPGLDISWSCGTRAIDALVLYHQWDAVLCRFMVDDGDTTARLNLLGFAVQVWPSSVVIGLRQNNNSTIYQRTGITFNQTESRPSASIDHAFIL
jgi:hypothetical protein